MNIILTESQLKKINNIFEQVVQGKYGDPYEYKKQGNIYFARKKGSNKWIQTSGKVSQAIQNKIFTSKSTNTKTTNNKPSINTSYKYSPRIDAELNYIKQRQGLWDKITGGKPFFIYDPKYNLIYLFDGDFSLVKSSSVVDGQDIQKDTKPFSHEDWCKSANLGITPYKCTNPQTKQKANPPYYVLNNLQVKFIPKGIYNISALGRHEGYEGKGNNVYDLSDSSGKDLAAARNVAYEVISKITLAGSHYRSDIALKASQLGIS